MRSILNFYPLSMCIAWRHSCWAGGQPVSTGHRWFPFSSKTFLDRSIHRPFLAKLKLGWNRHPVIIDRSAEEIP